MKAKILLFFIFIIILFSTVSNAQNNSLDFDGTDDYVLLPTDIVDLTTPYTTEAWINAADYSKVGTFRRRFIVLHDAGNNDLDIAIHETGKFTFVAEGTNKISIDTFPTNEWIHVALVFNGSDYALYVNGLELSMDDGGINTNNSTNSSYIGATYTDELRGTFSGEIDEVRIWNTARSASEIRENMCKTLDGTESGLAAYYIFDASSGSTLSDVSGNGNDGTLNNMDDTDWVDSESFNTWTGDVNSSWSEIGNWTDGVPTATDNVGIYNSANNPELSGAPTVNNLVLGSSASLTLSSDFTLNGNLILESELNLNGQTITLGSSGELVEDGGYLSGEAGSITTTRTLTNISGNVAGLGAEITENGDLGSCTIVRTHKSALTYSIARQYHISTTNDPTDATFIFHYSNNELNGQTEANLKLFKSEDGNSWSKANAILNATENTISLTGVNSFSYWTAATTSNYSGGSGTTVDPYQVTNLDDLKYLSEHSDDWDLHFIQTADIDASITSEWNIGDHDEDGGTTPEEAMGVSPIGNSTTNFSGSYNGQNHTIINLFINRPATNYIGFFGHTNAATIKNLGLTNCNITGGFMVGSLVAYNYQGSIITNSYCTGSVSGLNSVGGLVGANVESAISNCYSLSDVARNSGSDTSFGGFIGSNGLAGPVNGGEISYCYSSGSVIYVGVSDPTNKGFVGEEYGVSPTYTSNFFNAEVSNQTTDAVGAAIGKSTAKMSIQNTFSNWDFISNWSIENATYVSYPYLQAFTYDTPNITPEVNPIPGLAEIVNITWTGATNTDWNTASNWNPNMVPNATNNVIIPTVATNYPRISSGADAEVRDLSITASGSDIITIEDGGKLTVNGSYNLSDGAIIKVIGTEN